MTSTLLAPAAQDVVDAGPAQTPYLVLDVADAVARCARLRDAFGQAAVHYAGKANPYPALLRALVRAGGRFDVASAGELERCLAAGAAPHHLLFSNPVKRRADIAYAYACGVRRFVADSTGELDKLAPAVPGASVLEAAGAYTTALSTVGCNGFPALPTVLR